MACAGAAQRPPPATPPVDAQQVQDAIARMMGRGGAAAPTVAPGGIEVVIGTGHTAAVTAVALSRDGRYALSASIDETVKLWDTAARQEVRSLANPSLAPPRRLGFSADGGRALLGYADAIEVRDTASGARVARLDSRHLVPLLINASGTVASTQVTSGIAVIDPSSGAGGWSLPGGERLQQLALSEDGRFLALRAADAVKPTPTPGRAQVRYEVQLWDLTAHLLARRFAVEQRSDFDGAVALGRDGTWLALEAGDGSVSVYETATGRRAATLATGVAARPWTATLAFSPTGELLAFASLDGVGQLWKVADGAPVNRFAASTLAFSADGRQLVLGQASGGAPVLYEIASAQQAPIAAGATELADLALLGGGAAAATAAGAAGVKLWDLATGELVATIPCADAGNARSVAASTLAPLLAIGCADGSVILAVPGSGTAARVVRPPAGDGAFHNVLVRFADDGRHFASVVDAELALWDADTGTAVTRLALPPPPPPPPAPSLAAYAMARGGPRGAAAATAPTPAAAAPATSELELMMSADRVQALALRPDGAVAAIGRASELAVWDLGTGKLLGRLARATPAPKAGLPPMFDPAEGFQAFNPQRNGATGLAFSPNGRVLLASGTYGQRLWDLQSGQEVRVGGPSARNPMTMDPMALLAQMEMAPSRAAALSADGRLAARAYGARIRLTDLASGAPLAELAGHTSEVSALAFSADGRRLVSGGRDGALRIWSLGTGGEAAALYAVGREDFVDVTPDRYYRVSRAQLQGVAFRRNDELFPFEQFDLRFNRPDVLMLRLGLAPPPLIAGYTRAYEKRLRKMGFSSAVAEAELHLPTVEVLSGALPVATESAAITIRVRATDEQVALDRLNLYVNDVPVFGAAGMAIAGDVHVAERALEVPLSPGHNKVQVSVLNRQGAESLRRTLYTTSSADPEPWDVWVVAIGVSAYRNPHYALRFAAKDATDLAQAFRALDGRHGAHRDVHVRVVTDADATRAGIRAAKDWLRAARRQDLVVIFAAGHGIVDDHQNYYYGTWDIDADDPAAAGLPFEDFEDLLDGIAPLRKVLLVDTCFSGEIDRDEVRTLASTEGGDRVTMREYKAARNIVPVAGAMPAASAPTESLAVQQDLFADLRRGTGAVVISSSSGNEYSLEGEQWHNGVFTYAVLQGLIGGQADRNGDGVVSVTELQAYVLGEVRRLTRGAQNPTVRRENLDFDFAVY